MMPCSSMFTDDRHSTPCDRSCARPISGPETLLRSQWRAGALSGRTEEDAFFVKSDRTTMTQDDILNGRLICELGVAPLRPGRVRHLPHVPADRVRSYVVPRGSR